MLYITYPLNALLMIALPVGLGVFLAERLRQRWSLFGIGAITFVASQVVHIPLNFGPTALFARNILPQPPEAWLGWFNPVVLGLTAGLCEEVARYAVYRWWIRSARTWGEALMFGAGHGGVEAILLGVSVAATFLTLYLLQRGSVDSSIVPPEQREALAQQVAVYWSAPWPLSLLGAVERAFALCLHLSLAVLVLQGVARRNPLWLAGAILWHTAANAVALMALPAWGATWTEAVIGLFALASLGIVFALRPAPAVAAPPSAPEGLPPVQPAPAPAPGPEAEMRRRLDETRYDNRD